MTPPEIIENFIFAQPQLIKNLILTELTQAYDTYHDCLEVHKSKKKSDLVYSYDKAGAHALHLLRAEIITNPFRLAAVCGLIDFTLCQCRDFEALAGQKGVTSLPLFQLYKSADDWEALRLQKLSLSALHAFHKTQVG